MDTTTILRTCTSCKIPKPLDDFHVHKRWGPFSKCKDCHNQLNKVGYRRRMADPIKRAKLRVRKRESSRRIYAKMKQEDRVWHRTLLDNHGMQVSQYNYMLEKQGGVCALCKCIPIKRLYVDHDHENGVFRGLLCMPCNSALGQLGDNVAGLKRALDYLFHAATNPVLSQKSRMFARSERLARVAA